MESTGAGHSSARPADRDREPRDEFLATIDTSVLPRTVIRDLETLSDSLADQLKKLLAASRLTIEDEPEVSFEYAKKARELAPRVAVVRETYGVAAYRMGDFKNARIELQAARRMAGRDDLLPLIADCERGLGNPEQALKLATEPAAKSLQGADSVEMLLVVAGARQDLGQNETAVVLLEKPASLAKPTQPWAARLLYAYADALHNVGRDSEAIEWFSRADRWDDDDVTDAVERIVAIRSGESSE